MDYGEGSQYNNENGHRFHNLKNAIIKRPLK